MVRPDAHAPWASEQNAIHIWPRGQHMLISFPNLDGSTTCTLHMPYEGEVSYGTIRTEEQVRDLFAADFADALPYIDQLGPNYLNNPLISMVTVRCAPWSVGAQALLIGDAAHAIWPSYGQGANSGFEDCMTLHACLAANSGDVAAAFAEFEACRKPNTDAIAQLSEEHFYELRDKAGDAQFQLRKKMELKLNQADPVRYQPLYSLVSFSCTPFVEALRRQQDFDSVIDQMLTRPETEHFQLINEFTQQE
jgi:kynurenine 3-monooxygenase